VTITLEYRLAGRGWSEARIADGKICALVTASYLSDALGDLTWAVIGLLQGAEYATCSWWEEPGEYRWVFRRANDQVNIRILWFDDTPKGKPEEQGTVVFATTCRLVSFAGELKSQLQKLTDDFGTDAYKRIWVSHEFPSREYDKLRELTRRSRRSPP
jgi:hypothetical protein